MFFLVGKLILKLVFKELDKMEFLLLKEFWLN